MNRQVGRGLRPGFVHDAALMSPFVLKSHIIRRLLERLGPSAVFFNEFVDLLHQFVRGSKSRDDLLVVVDIIIGEDAAFSVLKPFLCRTIAADGEIPGFRTHALEVLDTVDKHAALTDSIA